MANLERGKRGFSIMITKIISLVLIALLTTVIIQQAKAIEGAAPWNYTKYANLPSPSPLKLKSIFSEGITIQIISNPWVVYQFENSSVELYLQQNGHNLNKLTPISGFDNLQQALAFIGLEVK